MVWVKNQVFKDTYDLKSKKYADYQPTRSVYSVSKGKKKGFQVWETQAIYDGKPSITSFKAYKTKKSKIFYDKKDAVKYAKEEEFKLYRK